MLWQWQGPARKVPAYIAGFLIGISPNPAALLVCSTPVVEGDRVYFVTHSFKVMCLDVDGMANGNDGPFTDEARYMVKEIVLDRGKPTERPAPISRSGSPRSQSTPRSADGRRSGRMRACGDATMLS